MFTRKLFRKHRRRGSVLIPTLFVMVLIAMTLTAILPLTLSGYTLSRADRDRTAALTAAEAGLNWEIARINNRLWSKDDSGTAGTCDSWLDETSAPPATASIKVLLRDASGNWTQRCIAGTTVDPTDSSSGGTFEIVSQGEVRAPDGHIVRRRVVIGLTSAGSSIWDYALISDGTMRIESSIKTEPGDIHSNGDLLIDEGASPTIEGDVSAAGIIDNADNLNMVGGGTAQPGQPAVSFPTVDEAQLLSDAIANGTTTGDRTYSNSTTLTGRYTGNVTIDGSPTITVRGPVWIDGSFLTTGSPKRVYGKG